jgi:hypothetical protein
VSLRRVQYMVLLVQSLCQWAFFGRHVWPDLSVQGFPGVLISYCSLAACPAATVQDFLERYEVGETVGVGGEYVKHEILPSSLQHQTWATSQLVLLLIMCCNWDVCIHSQGLQWLNVAGTRKPTRQWQSRCVAARPC